MQQDHKPMICNLLILLIRGSVNKGCIVPMKQQLLELENIPRNDLTIISDRHRGILGYILPVNRACKRRHMMGIIFRSAGGMKI